MLSVPAHSPPLSCVHVYGGAVGVLLSDGRSFELRKDARQSAHTLWPHESVVSPSSP